MGLLGWVDGEVHSGKNFNDAVQPEGEGAEGIHGGGGGGGEMSRVLW